MTCLRVLTFCLILLGLAPSALAEPVRSPHVASQLVSQTSGVAPGSTVYVALAQTLDKGWHTYWRNPGDAGEATTLAWTLPTGWHAGDPVWPTPKRLPVGPIMNYGYEGEVLLPVPIQVPINAKPGQTVTLAVKAQFLVCADVCIPGQAALTLALPVVAGVPAPDQTWSALIANALASAPKPAGLTAHFETSSGHLQLAIAGSALKGTHAENAYFFPYDGRLVDHEKAQSIDRGSSGLTLTLSPGDPTYKAPNETGGVLTVDGKAFEILATPGAAPPGSSGLGPPVDARSSSLGLALAGLYAFMGGLILNLMPCVFPILSMKAASLAGHGGETRGARGQGLAFLFGVVATFLALAWVLIAARAAGAAIGWGFQLQSPLVVASLGLIMLGAALNLSGLFEVGASVQGLGSSLASRGGMIGAVFTGILAVVVAAPCTAPFMGPALGFALTQPMGVALAVFFALGLGFAAPFTLLSFSPGLLARLPKPGLWMDTVKRALAFPMYGAAAWLLWVLSQQIAADGLARVLAIAVALSCAAWLYGLSQRPRSAGPPIALALAVAIAVVAGAGLFIAPLAPAKSGPEQSALPSEPFSPDRLATLRAAGKPVLVNFTAAWCVTCQVNERLAFSSPLVAEALKRSGGTYLVADWTNRDAVIAKALADQGRIGVPLYLVYLPGNDTPKVLPQLLSPEVLVQALQSAKS